MGPRNNLHGPGFSNTDLALIKHFQLTEKFRLEFHAEAFNAFNHLQLRASAEWIRRSRQTPRFQFFRRDHQHLIGSA